MAKNPAGGSDYPLACDHDVPSRFDDPTAWADMHQEHNLPDGVDDYFETHEQNDLQDWSDNEAWEDGLADSQDWGE